MFRSFQSSFIRNNLDSQVLLQIAAYVRITDQVHLKIGHIFAIDLSLTNLEAQLSLHLSLSLEVSDLLDAKQPACLGVAHNDPPLFILLFREELSIHRLVKDLQSFLVIFIFFSHDCDCQINLFIERKGANQIIFVSCLLSLELNLDERIAIANVGKASHLIFADWHKLVSLIVFHVHEVTDLFNSSFLLQCLNKT